MSLNPNIEGNKFHASNRLLRLHKAFSHSSEKDFRLRLLLPPKMLPEISLLNLLVILELVFHRAFHFLLIFFHTFGTVQVQD